MTQNNISTAADLAARHALLEEQLWQEIKQRLTENSGADRLYQWLAALADAPANADLAAWSPDKLDGCHYSAQNGLLVKDGEIDTLLDKAAVSELRESLAALPDGISQQEIIDAMLAACKRDHPELLERLQSFLSK